MRFETESDDDLRPNNPQYKSNWLSIATFFYTIKIFRLGHRRDMNEDDLTKPLSSHKSEKLGRKIAKLWSREVFISNRLGKKPSLYKVLIKCFWKVWMLEGLVMGITDLIIKITQPFFLGLLLRHFIPEKYSNTTETSGSPKYLYRLLNYWDEDQTVIDQNEAAVFATCLALTNLAGALVLHPYLMGGQHLGMQMRVACNSLIYRKTLRIDVTMMSGTLNGNIINLMSNDVNRFDTSILFLHHLWIAPLQMLVSLYMIYLSVGIPAIHGMIILFACIPLQLYFGFKMSQLRMKTAIRTDERMRQMNEIVQGMQVIKMYSWEYAFADAIYHLRKTELDVLSSTNIIRGLIMSFILFTTRAAVFITSLSFVLDGNRITSENVFFITAFYQLLRTSMTVFFPQGIAQAAELTVAINRIRQFLMLPETEVGDPTPLHPHRRDRRSTQTPYFELPHVTIRNASAKYGNDICLENITLEANAGGLTAVVGQVGTGKTCLLHLIMEELVPFNGHIKVSGLVSYASQEPWLFAGTVRQNILFGRPYERLRYLQVIKACALIQDFKSLPYGDDTIVGERGVSLSGGQRARVNLARAVYKEADIYLLDDPLSAVDTHVSKHLFEKCICGFLADKVVILVTHQLQYLKAAKQIVIMDNGKIRALGDFNSLQLQSLDYFSIVNPMDDPGSASDISLMSGKKIDKILKQISFTSALTLNIIDREGQKIDTKRSCEVRTYGSMNFNVLKQYLLAGGNCFMISFVIFLFIFSQFLASMYDFYMSYWVDNENYRTIIIINGVLIIFTVFFSIVRSLVFFYFCMKASLNLHNRMFQSIITGNMHFFNTNTSGRILNRFSRDIGDIDEYLPLSMIDFIQIFLNLVGSIIIIGLVNPYLIIPTIIICIFFYFLRDYFLQTSQSVKRLDGITRSPIYAHMNATIQGLTTIRSNGAEIILTSEFDKYQDVHSSAWFMFLATSRAFGYAVDIICTIYVVLVTFSFVYLPLKVSVAVVGLAITQSISCSGMIQWGLRQSADMQNYMTAVERVLEFTRIEHEPDLESKPENKPPPTWPSEGRIQYENVQLKYNLDEDPVLNDLTFTVEPMEKIGIVGRTGAGKSSLIASLFRLANVQGTILIDDLNTLTMGLHDLRKKISIIPQEPIIFSGTLRYNLDPFDEYNDRMKFGALKAVETKLAQAEGFACLDHVMTEGGSNISVGERQLVCMARAILRNNKILILDEATANVDPKTDDFIQKTIKRKFAHCTVLTIAHRLHTVMDSDKVLVMDAGKCVEFDHPHILLQNLNSYLTKMVEKTGVGMAKNLRQIAKESYDTNTGRRNSQ